MRNFYIIVDCWDRYFWIINKCICYYITLISKAYIPLRNICKVIFSLDQIIMIIKKLTCNSRAIAKLISIYIARELNTYDVSLVVKFFTHSITVSLQILNEYPEL